MLIVEDDGFTRSMVANALESSEINVVFSTGSATEALKFAQNKEFDVALLDLHIGPGPNGIDLAVAIRKHRPDSGIALLTSYQDPRLLNPNHQKIPAGVAYITKNSIADIDQLKKRIIKLRNLPLSRDEDAWDFTSGVSVLTDGQLEILKLMARGYSNAEISKQKFMTEKSVETAIRRIVAKLGIKNDPSLNQRVHIANVYFRALGKASPDD